MLNTDQFKVVALLQLEPAPLQHDRYCEACNQVGFELFMQTDCYQKHKHTKSSMQGTREEDFELCQLFLEGFKDGEPWRQRKDLVR